MSTFLIGGRREGRRRGMWALGAAVAVLSLTPTVAAAASITFIPPSNAHVDTTDAPPQYWRTLDQRPVVGIEADTSGQFQCAIDPLTSGWSWSPCGPPLAGCTATACASFQPASPLTGVGGNAMHDLEVRVVDGTGTTIASGGDSFTVDLTPPTLNIAPDLTNPLRPVFSVTMGDDEYGDPRLATDHADCSLTRLGAPPVWQQCAPPETGQGDVHYRLPRRHVDYRLAVRGFDDLGRMVTGHVDFDPLPCALRFNRPRSLGALITRGIPYRLLCSFTSAALITLVPLADNRARYEQPPIIAGAQVHRRGSRFISAGRLRLYPRYLLPTRDAKWVKFLLQACPTSDCSGPAQSVETAVFTLRR